MPRTYSFDHFQVPKTMPQSRSLRRRDKQHVAQAQKGAAAPAGLHYGKSHARTGEILQARAEQARHRPQPGPTMPALTPLPAVRRP